MFYIQQIGEHDCGITALKVLLANTFKKEDYLYLKEDEERGPYSFHELIDIAKKWKVTLTGVKFDTYDTSNYPSSPFLALIKIDEEITHLIYVDKIKGHSVYAFDPAKGRMIIKKKDFRQMFEGSALIIEKVEEEEPIEPKILDLERKEKIFASIIQILSYVALIFGVTFLRGDSYIFIPIICFALYLIFQILLERYLISIMRKVDTIYFELVTDGEHDPNLFIKRLNEYKKSLFISPIKLVGDIIISLFLSVIMIMNDFHSAYLIIAILVIIIFDILILRGYEKKKAEEIAYQENTLARHINDENYMSRVAKLHDDAYHLMTFKRTVRYISIFILLLVSIGVMMMSNIVSVPFVLIHLIFSITIFDKLKEIVYFDDDIEKKKVDYMKLINLIKK